MSLLDGLRVLEFAEEIAGPYAGKLLADAGAEVIKVEAPDGDPLRRWSASGADLAGRDGALFQYLNTSKRSVVGSITDAGVDELISGAHLLIESGGPTAEELAAVRAAHPDLSVVSVTPFGRTGPWAGRPATEFTLQAWCGSTAARGRADREPLYAGGRIGEWVTGAYAAVAALAVALTPGEHADMSMLECMAVTLGSFAYPYASLAGTLGTDIAPERLRFPEVPSISETSDGLVGFCTVTGQQLEDFLLMIGRPELRGDPRYASALRRVAHEREFTEMVEDWTRTRTTEEVIEAASALRIPVAPVGTPETISSLDHFVALGIYVENPGDAFLQPRVAYRVSGVEPRPLAAAPGTGENAGETWSATAPGANGPSERRSPAASTPGRPLQGLRVVDLTAFWAGPAATHMMASLGAEVIKVEGVSRPDGMRFNSTRPPDVERWWEWSPVFHSVNTNKRGITLELGSDAGRELLWRLIERADVLVENFSPRVLDGFGLGWESVHARNPRMIMLRMPGFGLDGPWRDRTGFAQTMEQASGMAWITGYADGGPLVPRGPCDPLAGMHAVFALLATLRERERSGAGRLVEVTMIEAALSCAAEVVIEHSAYGASLTRQSNRGPCAAPQGVYACAGKERWLALAVVTDENWSALCRVLGDPEWTARSDRESLTTARGRRAAHDEIDAWLRETLAPRQLDEVLAELLASGVPTAAVVPAVEIGGNEQLRSRQFFEPVVHPVIGEHEMLGVPFRIGSRPDGVYERAAPTLGQHNEEILGGLLGLSASELEGLAAAGVIADRPGGSSRG